MKRLVLPLLAFFAIVPSLQAVLPPFYQSRNELQSILSSNELAERIGSGEPIMIIERNDQGYLIRTNKHQVQIDVIYAPAKMPGPAQYRFNFHEIVPLN